MRWIALVVAFAVFVAAASGLSAAPLPPEINVGAVETLTGTTPPTGCPSAPPWSWRWPRSTHPSSWAGAASGSVVMDDKADKQEGISVFTRLINDDKVSVIIGPTLSSTAFAADPIAQKAGVPVLGTSNTATGITAMGTFVFRDSLLQAGVIPGTLAAVKERYHPQKAALLFESTNEFSKSEADVFTAVLQSSASSSWARRATARATRTSARSSES